MTAIRILHVDDEPDIREIVDLSLGLNPDFEVRAAACGADAIAIAAEWSPFLILLDVMMPVMDGPTTLTHLRKDPRTADIPVLFMTARAQEREVQQFIALGAQGVISKPFDPMTLAFLVRSHLQAIRLESLRAVFTRRAMSDAAALADCRSKLSAEAGPAAVARVREIAHGLAGAAGLFGFGEISSDAAALEEAVVAKLEGGGTPKELTQAIDQLMARLKTQWESRPAETPKCTQSAA
jgi:CheY-like chemotaxis protein